MYTAVESFVNQFHSADCVKIVVPSHPSDEGEWLTVHENIITTHTTASSDENSSTIFTVHKDLLTKHGGYFAATLAKNAWQEGVNGEITIADYKPASAKMFQQWCYTKLIFSMSDASDELDNLIDSYLLGKYLMASEFQDHIMDAMSDVLQKKGVVLEPETIAAPWDKISPNSEVYALMINCFKFRFVREHNYYFRRELEVVYPADILFNVIHEWRQGTTNIEIETFDPFKPAV